MSMRKSATLPIFTIMHPLVDALSASVLWIGADGIMSFVAYNFFAFALQLPFGIILDRWPQALKESFVVGMALLVGGGVLALCCIATLPVICVCCIGNALFHLTAGKVIMDCSEGRSGPVACFISTGALGLLIGKLFAVSCTAILIPFLVVVLIVGCAMAIRVAPFTDIPPFRFHCIPAANWCAMAALFVIVVGRGWIVLYNGAIGSAVSLMLIGALVSLAGQVTGGYLSERIGWRPVVGASIVGSLLLYLGVGFEAQIAWFAILFLAQSATGPVLSLIYHSTDGASGTSFGLNCLGLFVGTF